MASTKIRPMSPLKVDLVYSTLVGIMASLFAVIVLTNLGYFEKAVGGINLTIPMVFAVFIPLCIVGILTARAGSKYLPILYKFGKFGEAGGLNWLVDLGVLNLLILLTGMSTGIYFIVYKGISFIMASTNSYFWNKNWVFSDGKKQKQGQEIGKFAMATTMGLVVNVVIAGVIAFVGPLIFSGIDSKTWANLATISGSLTAMIFNFVIYKIWVFKS